MLQDESKHNTDLYQYSIKQMAAIPAASTGLGKYLGKISIIYTNVLFTSFMYMDNTHIDKTKSVLIFLFNMVLYRN